jgi:UDP-N-acetylmuramate dehydrogenase
MSQIIKFFEDYKSSKKIEGKLLYNHSLAKSSWLGVGGAAEVFYLCESFSQLSDILKKCPKKINRTVIGQGSNILIRDGGIKGLVIKLGKNFQNINRSKEGIIAGGATLDRVIAKYCEKESISGLEFLSGIPGNIGGAFAMNAGCYNNDLDQVFYAAEGLDYNGNKIKLKKSDVTLDYRHNPMSSSTIFTQVSLLASKGKQEDIKNKIEKIFKDRILAQPRGIKTGGSTFKNPDEKTSSLKAWELIQKSDCHKIKLDGVSFSKKHSNFIENKQNVSANLIEDFCRLVQKDVFEKTGVELLMEIKILGER